MESSEQKQLLRTLIHLKWLKRSLFINNNNDDTNTTNLNTIPFPLLVQFR